MVSANCRLSLAQVCIGGYLLYIGVFEVRVHVFQMRQSICQPERLDDCRIFNIPHIIV